MLKREETTYATNNTRQSRSEKVNMKFFRVRLIFSSDDESRTSIGERVAFEQFLFTRSNISVFTVSHSSFRMCAARFWAK